MKEKFSVSVDDNLLKWLDSEIKDKRFASRSHGIEFALNELKKKSWTILFILLRGIEIKLESWNSTRFDFVGFWTKTMNPYERFFYKRDYQ